MNDRLTAEIERIRSDKSIPDLDEDNVKRVAIEPLLKELGWNTYDTTEFRSEYNLSNRKVDYALRLNEKTKVFLEAKNPSENWQNTRGNFLNTHSRKEHLWRYLPTDSNGGFTCHYVRT